MKTETKNSTAVRQEIEALRHTTVGQLKGKYREVLGESSRSNHMQFLFRRYRLAHPKRMPGAAFRSRRAAALWKSLTIPISGSRQQGTSFNRMMKK
jgi:hypothetical protein